MGVIGITPDGSVNSFPGKGVTCLLKNGTGVYWRMNANIVLEKVKDLAKAKMLELQPFAGEEMNLPQTNDRRDGFVDGERTLAAEILALIEEAEKDQSAEEKMVLGI